MRVAKTKKSLKDIKYILIIMKRKYLFLKKKYYELLLPTLLMVMSEKICSIIDVFLVGFFVGGHELPVINLVTPLLYVTGIFYILFGQGGNLLALRAKSERNEEKSNFYFTISIIGIILISLIYISAIIIFSDNILHMFNTPADIYNTAKNYMQILVFFFPLNCYMFVLSFFIRSDGFPKLPFYSVLLANIINIIFDVIFLSNGMGVKGAALATVIGYSISSIYISKYFFSREHSFKFISIAKLKIKLIIASLKKIILNTPEVMGKIFFAIQIGILTYLCSTYYGAAGLLAFLVYDNSETFVYMFLSGIMKTMSPIVTVFNKEMDFKAVQYIIKKSLRQVLLCSIPISILFFIWPEILIKIFNITSPRDIEVVIFAIRITSFGLVGRCVSYLMANYTQAIQQNKIALGITLLEEFIISIGGALLLTKQIGGVGIWIAILLSETIPVVFYIITALYFKRSHKNKINDLLMLQDSKLINETIERNNIEHTEDISTKIKKLFDENASIVELSIKELCDDIFNHKTSIDEIDMTIRLIEDKAIILLIDDGELYNPMKNEKFLNSPNIKKLSQINGELEYTNVLGFNKSYIIFNKSERFIKTHTL